MFRIDYAGERTPLFHYWEVGVGSCHAYTALREDYRKYLKRAHDELGFQYIRFHGLFDDEMSVCVHKKSFIGEDYGIIYNFANIDNIYDFLLSIGMKPFVEIGFMPGCLAGGKETCFYYKGNISLPTDDREWEKFIKAFLTHLIERYGKEEVESWFFEIWNEPNIPFFFEGGQKAYFDFYARTVRALKSVDVKVRVGGPATTINAWVTEMIQYCEENKVPLDFVSTHHYPTDDPLWKQKNADMAEMFAIMQQAGGKYEREIMKKMTAATREKVADYPLYYTEWSTSALQPDQNHDNYFAASMIAKILTDNIGLVDGYMYWTFSDIFEESGQFSGPFHGGFGLMNYYGIPKPAYRAFELFHALGKERLTVINEEEQEEQNAQNRSHYTEMVAAADDQGMQLIAYNYNIQDQPIAGEKIAIVIESIPEVASVEAAWIDDCHANPLKAWERLGEPEYPSKEQIQEMENASKLVFNPLEYVYEKGTLTIRTELAPYATVGYKIRFV